jgi:hypothetical protein
MEKLGYFGTYDELWLNFSDINYYLSLSNELRLQLILNNSRMELFNLKYGIINPNQKIVNAVLKLMKKRRLSIELQPFIFVLISVLAFIIVGKNILHWKSYLWIVLISLLGIYPLPQEIKSVSIILLIAIPVICLYIYYSQPKKKKEVTKHVTGMKNKLRTWLMFALVFPRILFFNVAHYLFPLLFIWISIYGLVYLLGFLTIINFNVFISLMSLLGIIFGFFQYYIKRYRENIQNKLVKYVTKLTLPKEFTIKEFKDFIEPKQDYKPIFDKIIKIETPKTFGMFRRTKLFQVDRMLQDLQGSPSDIEVFNKLEKEIGGKTKLKEAYREFFTYKKEENLKKLEKKNVKEFLWLLMGNINIISEDLIKLETLDLPEVDEEPETYSEFFTQTSYEILNEIFTRFIYE